MATVEDTTHIVPMPRWYNFLQTAKAIVALAVLALTACTAHTWGPFTALTFSLFTSSASILLAIYHRFSFKKPIWYNRYAVLGLEIFGLTFWLISLALLSEWTATYNSSDYWYREYDRFGWYQGPYMVHPDKHSVIKRRNKYHVGLILAGVATGLSGLAL